MIYAGGDKSGPHTPASNASHLSERAAQIEAAAVELAAQLADKQQELNRRRREAALAAKAALVDQMKASIAEIDSEIQVGILITCRYKYTWMLSNATVFPHSPQLSCACNSLPFSQETYHTQLFCL